MSLVDCLILSGALALFGGLVWFVFFRKADKKVSKPVPVPDKVPSPEERWASKPGKGVGAEKDHPQGKEFGWEKNDAPGQEKKDDVFDERRKKEKKDKKDK